MPRATERQDFIIVSQLAPLIRGQRFGYLLTTTLSKHFIAFLALLFAACSTALAAPLSFDVPAGWKSRLMAEFYSVTSEPPNNGLLMFSPWPPKGKREDIPNIVESIAGRFAQRTGGRTNSAASWPQYEMKQVSGAACEGTYAVFDFKMAGGKELVQTMFMMYVGERIWQGQFTGPPEKWQQALSLLQSVKKGE